MPDFQYVALDQTGRRGAGVVEAGTRDAAVGILMGRGLCPMTVGVPAAAAQPTARRIPRPALDAFTYGLANLLAAGVPLGQALATLVREATHPAARATWEAVRTSVVDGTALADALARHPRVFPPVYVAMVRAGEAGGFLDTVLGQIAVFQAREDDLKGRVKAALIYPAVLMVLATGVVAFLLTYFIPRFSAIFAEFGSALPWLTRAIVAASGLALAHGPIMVGAAIVAALLLRAAVAAPGGRRAMDRALLATPVVGTVAARHALVRFCRMLGTLVGSGVPLVTSLRAAQAAIGNQALADAVDRAVEEVRRGEPLARSLAPEARLFPPSVIAMVAVAEETGRLGPELVRMAEAYDGDLERRLRVLVALVEPALLFVMAALIGTVVIGMLLPVFTLQDLVR